MANTDNTTRTLKYKIGGGSWTTDSTIPAHVETVGQLQEYLTSTIRAEFNDRMVVNMNLTEEVNLNEPLVNAVNQDVMFLTWQSDDKKGGYIINLEVQLVK
tara:strand:+ start:333 stop:635 length:303 start_codon:yes stop_codon:yes gene_type:complete